MHETRLDPDFIFFYRAHLIMACRSEMIALSRALELMNLTITDERWKGQRKELTRARELLCDAMSGGKNYGSNLASLGCYFFHFAMVARVSR